MGIRDKIEDFLARIFPDRQQLRIEARVEQTAFRSWENEDKEFCICTDSARCGCAVEPQHCQWCCLDLTPEQTAAEDKRLEDFLRGNGGTQCNLS